MIIYSQCRPQLGNTNKGSCLNNLNCHSSQQHRAAAHLCMMTLHIEIFHLGPTTPPYNFSLPVVLPLVTVVVMCWGDPHCITSVQTFNPRCQSEMSRVVPPECRHTVHSAAAAAYSVMCCVAPCPAQLTIGTPLVQT